MMSKSFLIIAFVFSIGAASACSTATAPNNSAGNTNAAGATNAAAPVNIPPEFSNAPIPPSGNSTPGIPDPRNVNAVPAGTTPTPGIPDSNKIGKTPVPKGATPTPGIPPPEVLREQMNRTIKDANVVNQATKTAEEVEKKVDQQLKGVRRPNQ